MVIFTAISAHFPQESDLHLLERAVGSSFAYPEHVQPSGMAMSKLQCLPSQGVLSWPGTRPVAEPGRNPSLGEP
jgi:hypothetical protein